ncbi:MAG TPA: 16S rRNA (uracil(1498)-N(3))-methyltransferase [Gammaproteobacteria bacterium]
MRVPRIFHSGTLQAHIELELAESAANHVARVLRMREQAPLIIFNGSGGEYRAHISRIDKRRVVAALDEFIQREVESPLRITLAQGISRGERMDYTLQKAVELGITTIVPLLTEHCVVELKGERLEKRLEHWRGVIIGACEQCGRNRLPELLPVISIEEWLVVAREGVGVMLDHRAPAGINTLPVATSYTLLVGPEGGLSPQEQQQALAAGYLGMRLGPRVLRTETAALVALAALQARFGDLG